MLSYTYSGLCIVGFDTVQKTWRSRLLQQVADLSTKALNLAHDDLWIGQQAFLPNCCKFGHYQHLTTDTF